ncbi:MAG: hypothetical protein ACOYIK_05205 [Coriobacteriales bacterium]
MREHRPSNPEAAKVFDEIFNDDSAESAISDSESLELGQSQDDTETVTFDPNRTGAHSVSNPNRTGSLDPNRTGSNFSQDPNVSSSRAAIDPNRTGAHRSADPGMTGSRKGRDPNNTTSGMRPVNGTHAHENVMRSASGIEISEPMRTGSESERMSEIRSVSLPSHSREEDSDSSSLKILLLIFANVIYWGIVAIGCISPFLPDFNFGSLAPWQIIFSRLWLSFVLLGAFYAAITNVLHFRNWKIFQKSKVKRITLFLVGDVVVSFVLIRLICLF